MSSQHSQHDDESVIESQSVKQTQPSSQGLDFGREIHENVWGSFYPLVKDMKEVNLFKPKLTYRIGRSLHNDVVFPGYKISNKHAEITWDGRETKDSIIMLRDNSSNGTYVNGQRLGKGVSRILPDGAEVAFGSPGPSSTQPAEDYRFIFRHTASGQQREDGFYGLYDSHDQLGRGTFASVVRCLERKTGILWAAKMFSNLLTGGGSSSLGSRSNEKMVSREIGILQTLSHPNICFLKETFITEERKLILVLELIEGGDLLEYILSSSGVSEEITQHITYQLCLALSYVHSRGIAHRDLKPENILLTKSNPPDVKVADFGLAKAIDSQTMLKTMCGTPAYLAPEIVTQTNMEGYDNLVDSWSVGAIVFSMLTNASPFIEDENQPDIRVRISTLIDFIERLLNPDPAVRMTLANALDHLWLQDYQVGPSNTNDRAGVSSNSASADHPNGAADDDSEMDDATPPPPPPSQTRKLQSQNSRVLRRRKDVLEDANAGEMTIPRPSPELLSQFDEKRKREEDVGKPATGPSHTPEKRRGKRAHGDLSAVPEMADNGSGSGGRIAAMSAENGSADDSGAQPTPSKRRRNAPPSNNATRGKKVKKPTEPAVGVRRSSRNKSASA
ncbi:MAG: CAMK/RAD53 protein kinase [Lentinula lateritia]|nr:MAG: CAMK/RAD53 protein kinase [Lentinula lateritia]